LEKTKGRRQLGTPRHRPEDNIKIDLKAVECVGVECNDFPRQRVKWEAVVKGSEHWGFIKFGEYLGKLSNCQLLKKDSSSLN